MLFLFLLPAIPLTFPIPHGVLTKGPSLGHPLKGHSPQSFQTASPTMETFSSSPNDKCLEDLLSKHAATSKAHEGLRILEVCHGPFKHHDFLPGRFPGAVHLHCHQCASGELKPCDKNGPSAFRSAVTYSSGTARSIAASNQSQDLVILAYAGYETMEDSQRPDVLK